MDAVASAKKPVAINRWLPYWAVFQADFGQTIRNWVYRLWVLTLIVATTGWLLYRAAPAKEYGLLHPASLFMSELLNWTILVSVTLVVVLTAGSISGERGSMADSILSRGISRYQYFMGKWHARLVAVLVTFLAMGVVAWISSLMVLHEDLSLVGGLMAMATVAAMLTVVSTAGVTVSAMASSTVVAMAVLWVLLYGLGFAMSLLPAHFATPDRILHKLPYMLRGYFDLEMHTHFIGLCLVLSLILALVGMIHFSRRDV
jgi:putative exporter of polyketide antibiotics